MKFSNGRKQSKLPINFLAMDDEDKEKDTVDPDLMEEAAPDLGDTEETDLL